MAAQKAFTQYLWLTSMNEMNLQILSDTLLESFKASLSGDLAFALADLQKASTPAEYFDFYNAVSSVYSSKIEGEAIDFDSYFKHKFLKVSYQADYTKKPDDLFKAYEFILKTPLTLGNLQKAHSILTMHLLPPSQQGKLRTGAMFVINSDDRIDYVAAESGNLSTELGKLFADIDSLLAVPLSIEETLYFGSFIHLVFVKIHPFADGNGRSARLLEKWFLIRKLGSTATAIQLEKNYFVNLQGYYQNLRVLGLEYENLEFDKALPFLMMTAKGLLNHNT